MYALDMLDAGNGWSGGMAGFVFHYTGTQWEGVPTNFDKPIFGLDMIDATSGWGVAQTGQIIRYDGGGWSIHSKPAGPLSDVKMLSATEGWAVGGSAILRYNAGSDSWDAANNPSSYYLKAIDMIGSNDGWIVGLGGTVLHWDGMNWSGGSIGQTIQFFDVCMVSPTDVWAVGGEGIIYHYDGDGWSLVPSPTANTLSAVDMLNANDGWAVGENGTLAHYDGSEWRLVASPTTWTLNAVQMVDSEDVWAMGAFGTILHYTGAPADLSSSSKVVDLSQAVTDDVLTYTINVKNSGADVAAAVAVTDTIPLDATYVDGSASTTKGTIEGPDPLVVTVGDLDPGEEVTISFQVSVDDLGSTCHFIRNEARIGMEGAEELVRSAATSVGDCYGSFLPLVIGNE
jgi:uncharacterized repeat protein (TIGR01451 family)